MTAPKRTSLNDIARQLGVSVSTVSRALNDHPSISSGLKEKARHLAEELHYIPNTSAVNLKTGRRNTIGIIVPGINRSFFSSAIEGIEDKAYEYGYDVLICQSKDSSERERQIVDSLIGKVDGVIASIAADTSDHSYYNLLTKVGIQLVLFDRETDKVEAGKVLVNDFLGAKTAVRHLLDQGCRRIFHIGGPNHISIWGERERGYREAMKEAGIDVPEEWILTRQSTKEAEGREAAEEILGKARKSGETLPDALFCAGDFLALGAMLEFQEAGIVIPDDIAIVGFANEPFCSLLPVPLSSVVQFSYTIGEAAGQMLFERLAGQPQVSVVIKPELMVRTSSIVTNRTETNKNQSK